MAEAGDPDLCGQVIALGQEGRARVEIAAALGVSMGRLRGMETESPDLAAALRRAETAAQAWWEAAQREALAGGARVNAGAWREAMAWRFGAAGQGAAGQPSPVRARVNIPYNGRPPRRAPGRM